MTRFGVQVSTAMTTMHELRSAWRQVEALGFEWISGQDHFYTLRAPDADSYEALTCHAALATVTTKPRVGCLVYSAGYRQPAVMANALATIDHLSDGRLEVGIGAGWLQAEYEDYGMEFEPPAVRLRRMKEYVEVIRTLWTEAESDYDGEFYSLRNARCDPKPIQTLPRIWIGAKGARALGIAAQVGDGWNAQYMAPGDFAERVQSVKAATKDPSGFAIGASVVLCMADEADFDGVMTGRYGPVADDFKPATLRGSIQQVAEKVHQYAEAGADWIIIALRPPFRFEELEQFAADVMPQFHQG